MLNVKCLTKVDELTAISGQWDQLLAQSLNNSYSLSWAWLSRWLSVYLPYGRLLCLAVFDDDKLVGLAPLWVHRQRQLGLGHLKILRFIGSEEVCPDHLDLIVSRKNSDAICTAIWEHLHGPLRREWDIWEYNYVPSDSQVLHSLNKLSERDDRCLAMTISGYTVCPYSNLSETWEAHLVSLSSNSRGSLKASAGLLTEAGKLELSVCTTAESISSFMGTLIDLHRKSWQERGRSGSFSTEKFRQFHRELAEDLLASGNLLLCNLELDGTPVGSFYGFEHNKVMHGYLLGTDRSAVPRASIGRVLLARCLEVAISRGCREFDWLRGYEDYKYHWTDRERRELLVTFHNRTFGALVHILEQFVVRYSKQVGKVVLGSKTQTVKRWLGRGI
ncbi:MAG: GNAT family N-acetyltransferase [candidate division Zixibacteria bacterium]|nr:GNAT family N-acetyltransferase [candidate division Zixibacteria bacterium]